MARRRAGLPAEIRSELPMRAQAGIGLDLDYRPDTAHRPARIACRYAPTHDMLAFVRKVDAYVRDHGGTQVRLLRDFREQGAPGALLLAWTGAPAAADVAAQFAVSTAPCGTPRLPAWLALRVDDNFDLRWQPSY